MDLPPPPAVGFDGGPGEWPGDPRELVSCRRERCEFKFGEPLEGPGPKKLGVQNITPLSNSRLVSQTKSICF